MSKQLVIDVTDHYTAYISDETGKVVLHSGSGESGPNEGALGAVRSLALLLSDMIDARDARLAQYDSSKGAETPAK